MSHYILDPKIGRHVCNVCGHTRRCVVLKSEHHRRPFRLCIQCANRIVNVLLGGFC